MNQPPTRPEPFDPRDADPLTVEPDRPTLRQVERQYSADWGCGTILALLCPLIPRRPGRDSAIGAHPHDLSAGRRCSARFSRPVDLGHGHVRMGSDRGAARSRGSGHR